MSEKITQIIDLVKELSVVELGELVSSFEEEFGVTAAAVAVAGAGAAAPAAGAAGCGAAPPAADERRVPRRQAEDRHHQRRHRVGAVRRPHHQGLCQRGGAAAPLR